jgi:hypothetical protein
MYQAAVELRCLMKFVGILTEEGQYNKKYRPASKRVYSVETTYGA